MFIHIGETFPTFSTFARSPPYRCRCSASVDLRHMTYFNSKSKPKYGRERERERERE